MDDFPTLISQGLTRAEIAERLGVTTRTVDRRLRALRLGSPLPGRRTGRPPKMTEEEVKALVQRAQAEGWTKTRAAEEAGVTRPTLNGLLGRYGVEW